jgi:F0F1-type ATP synthase epsilon subunit
MKIFFSGLVTFTMFCSTPAINAFSVKNFSVQEWYDWAFDKNYHQKTLHQEYAISGQEKIRLINQRGSVTVKTNWNQQKILMTAIIKGKTPESLAGVHITQKQLSNLIELQTCQTIADDIIVDYQVIIPAQMSLEVATSEGNIEVKQITQPTLLTTTNGSISIYKTHNSVIAQVFNKGSIDIEHAHGTVKAGTKYGDITIRDAHTSIIAHAQHGSITVHNEKVPSTAKIELMTDTGSITAQLPCEVNAEVQAHTKKGIVTCEHVITLKPFTTSITKHTFDRLKKDIEGTLGSGEAQIYLSALKGDISIQEARA